MPFNVVFYNMLYNHITVMKLFMCDKLGSFNYSTLVRKAKTWGQCYKTFYVHFGIL